jgi:RNA polymerase sigma-70 factor (ECF subfamily)
MQHPHLPLWDQFNAELKAFLCRQLKQEDVCNDILQELYLKMYINRDKLEKVHNIRAYLFQMAHNALIDYHRRAARETESSTAVIPESEAATLLPDEYMLADCLRAMINGLPQIYSEALILTELEGMTQKQYAEKAGISLSGAKSRVQRAREKLKEEIINCCQYEFDKYGNILSCCKNGPAKKKYC